MAQVHNKVNAGIMDAVTCCGMMEEGASNEEVWYRGFKSKYGSDHNHLLWLTDDIDYARSYGNRIEEIIINSAKVNAASIEEMDEVGDETEEWFDYLDGPSDELAHEMLIRGYNCYCFEANGNSSYCMCLWDKSPIISRRELSREEYERIEGYEGYDNYSYDTELDEAAEPEDNEYKLGGEMHAPIGGVYYHTMNESSDVIPYLDLTLKDERAIPFVIYVKPDGEETEMFVGNSGEEHFEILTRAVREKKITKEEFGTLWDIKRNEYKSGRIWLTDYGIVASFYSYRKDNYKRMYRDIYDSLSAVSAKSGIEISIGKVILDFWTFNSQDVVLIPVRWLNNGTADVYFPYMTKCVPAGDDIYNLSTTRGGFLLDWNGDEADFAFGMIREQKETPKSDYQKYIKSIIDFLKGQHLNIFPLPKITLNNEEQDGLFIKTGYYLPDEKEVVIFTHDRHIKDVLRSFVHEMVHHMQNLQDPNKDWGSGGDLEKDGKLRGIEGEAFLLGNILFREWTEYMKKKGLNESKTGKKKNDKGEIVPEKCDKCGGKVVLQIHGEPVYVCKECGKYFGTMSFPDNLNESIDISKSLKNLKNRRDPDNIENWDTLNEITDEMVEPDDVDLSSFNIKKHLNPKFWEDGHLDTRIRLKLLDIADDFYDSLGVDWVDVDDVIMTGSLANYNWDKNHSDIDLHILIDYEDVDERVDFVREYFTLKKNEWNQKHAGLKIFGFPVEVYVQDTNEPHASSGVYSIDRDEWITEPDVKKLRSGNVDKKHVREMVSTYMNKIDCLIDIYKHHKDNKYEMENVAKDAEEMFDEIKKMRKDDLAKYNREMCDGNIIFKALRRSDYIGKLIKLKNLTYDKINSL